MATTGHENEPVNVLGLKAALQQYKTSISDARTIIPVDEEALTPSSTFVKGNVVGINGTFYYCTADTSNFPVVLLTQGNAFVVNTIDGKRCFIVSNNTLQTGWMLWSDASVEYQLANFQQQINGKQNTLTFDSTPTANSNNPVTSTGIKTYVDYSCGKRHKLSNGSTLPIGYVNVLDWTSEVPSGTYSLTIIPPASDDFAYEADAIVLVTGNAGWSIRMGLIGGSTNLFTGTGSSRFHVIYVDGHIAVEVIRLTIYI